MSSILNSTFLRNVLLADAAASGATGLLMGLGATPLSGLLGLPEPLLRVAGLALLPCAGLIAWLATRPVLPRAAVWTLIAANTLWIIESVAILALGWVSPNGLGIAFVLAQAGALAVLTELEFVGLRRAEPAPADRVQHA